jgi:putative peptidoglycan lipid II flippase
MIFRNSLLLAFFSALSLLLGIVRDRLLADNVGISFTLDLYNASFRIPDLLYGSLLAFISAGTVVPFLTKEDSHGKQISPLHRLITLSSLFLFINVVIGLLLFILLPYIAHLIVPGFTASQREIYVSLTRLLMVQPIIMGLASLFSCYAQLRNEFILLGVSPLLYSLGIIYGILFLYPTYGVKGLIIGVILGALFALFLQAFSLRSLRPHHFKHVFSWSLTKEAVRLAIPRTGTNIISQVRTIIFQSFATLLGPGYLSAYLFALRVPEAVVQIIQQSATTASIPVLSRDFAERKIDSFKIIVRRYSVALFFIGAGLAVLIFLGKEGLVRLLYGENEMNALIVYFLSGALIALPFQMVTGYLSISFYSVHDARSVMIAFLISSVLSIGFLYFGSGDGAERLITANVFFWFASSLILLLFYSRKKL